MSVIFFTKRILVAHLIFLIGVTFTNATCTYTNVNGATINVVPGNPTQIICFPEEDIAVDSVICEVTVPGDATVTLTDYAGTPMTTYVESVTNYDGVVTDIQFKIIASIDDITDSATKSITGGLTCGGSPNDMFILQISPINDHIPEFTNGGADYNLPGVSELFPSNTNLDLLQFYGVEISSYDGDTNGDSSAIMDFSIISGDDQGTFQMGKDENACNSTYCVATLFVVGKLDYAKYPSYDLTIQVQDEGNPPLSSTAVLHIAIEDADNLNPQFQSTFYYSTADTINAGPYALTTTPSPILAIDLDTQINAPIEYSLVIDTCGASCDALTQAFSIDPATGVITFDSDVDLDAISNGVATFGVQAVQTDNADRSTLAIVSVTLPAPLTTTQPPTTTEAATTTEPTTTTPQTTTACPTIPPETTTVCPTIPPTTTTLTTTPTSTTTTVISTTETTITTCTTITVPADTTTTPEPTTTTEPTTTGLTSTGATCYCPTTDTDTTPTVITLTTTDCSTDATITTASTFTSSTTPYTITTNTGSTVTITTSGSDTTPVTSYTCSPTDQTTLSTATITGSTTSQISTDCTSFPTDTTIPSTGSTTPFTGSTPTVDPTDTSSSSASTTPFTGTTTQYTGTTTQYTGTTTQYTGTVTIPTGMTCYPTGSTDPLTGTTGTGTTPTGQTTGTTGTGTTPTGQTTGTTGTGTTPTGQTTGTTGTGTTPTGQTTGTIGTGTQPTGQTTQTEVTGSPTCPTTICPSCPTNPTTTPTTTSPNTKGVTGEIVIVSVLTPVNTNIIKVTDTYPVSTFNFLLDGGEPYFDINEDGSIYVSNYLQVNDYTLDVTITSDQDSAFSDKLQVGISVVNGESYPILPTNYYTVSIDENQKSAVEPLVDLNSTLEIMLKASYSIVNDSIYAYKFGIDATYGKLYLNTAFDCDTEVTSINVLVQVDPLPTNSFQTIADPPIQINQYLVNVNINDVNDNPPAFDPDVLTVAISSYTTSGQQVTQLTATDADVDPKNRDIYYKSVDNKNNFYVDENTGVLLASQPVNSLKGSYTITVIATNDLLNSTVDSNPLSVTINILEQTQILVIENEYSVEYFEDNHDQILNALTESLNSGFYLRATGVIQIQALKWVALDADTTKAYLYGLQDGAVMSKDELKNLVTNNNEAFTKANFVPTSAQTFDETPEAVVVVDNSGASDDTGLIAGISVLAVLLGICLIVGGVFGYKSYKKKHELKKFYEENNDNNLEANRKSSYDRQSDHNNMMYNERRVSQAINQTVNSHELEDNHLPMHDEVILEEVIHHENNSHPTPDYKDDSPTTELNDVLREFETVDNLNEINDFPQHQLSHSNSIPEIESPIADYNNEIDRASLLDEEPAKSILIDSNASDTDTLEDLLRKEELSVTFDEVAEIIEVEEHAPHDNLALGEYDEDQLE